MGVVGGEYRGNIGLSGGFGVFINGSYLVYLRGNNLVYSRTAERESGGVT